MAHEAVYREYLARMRAARDAHPKGPCVLDWSSADTDAFGLTFGRALAREHPEIPTQEATALYTRLVVQVSCESAETLMDDLGMDTVEVSKDLAKLLSDMPQGPDVDRVLN